MKASVSSRAGIGICQGPTVLCPIVGRPQFLAMSHFMPIGRRKGSGLRTMPAAALARCRPMPMNTIWVFALPSKGLCSRIPGKFSSAGRSMGKASPTIRARRSKYRETLSWWHGMSIRRRSSTSLSMQTLVAVPPRNSGWRSVVTASRCQGPCSTARGMHSRHGMILLTAVALLMLLTTF